MAIDNVEICRRLSPSTFAKIQERKRRAPFSLYWSAKYLTMIFTFIAGWFLAKEGMLITTLSFACLAAISYLIYRSIKNSDGSYIKLLKIAKEECELLVKEILHELQSKSQLKEFILLCTLESLDYWIAQEQQRSTSVSNTYGYYGRYAGQRTQEPDRAFIQRLEETKIALRQKTDLGYLELQRSADPNSVSEEALQAATQQDQLGRMQYAWYQSIQERLKEKSELLLAFLNRPLHPDMMKNIAVVVNDFATIALAALENPFPQPQPAA